MAIAGITINSIQLSKQHFELNLSVNTRKHYNVWDINFIIQIRKF